MGAADGNNKIDFVLIWVDGADPEWRAEKSLYDGSAVSGNTDVRFRDWDNLQYWFRGVEKFAPWVNRIHFVTWGHLPQWLDTSAPKLNIVNHKDFIPHEYLPTFNCNPIELNLHRISGLAEQFVYFNDDMFVTAPTEPEDFFINGHPCDTYGLNCIFFVEDSVGHINGSDLEQINNHFKSSKAVIRANRSKWYSRKNGFKNNIKTRMLSTWDWFPGFHYDHLPTCFLKSTYEEVWEKCTDALVQTCKCRFRSGLNVNQWLMKYWQLCKGISEPRREIGRVYHLKDDEIPKALAAVEEGKHKLICLNDTAMTADFEETSRAVRESFEKLLPERSSFEK